MVLLLTACLLQLSPRLQLLIKEVYASTTLPTDADAWTENDNATYTWRHHPSVADTLSFTSADVQVGSYALNITHSGGGTEAFVFLELGSTDASAYTVCNLWAKVDKNGWTGNYFDLWLTEDNSTGWYNQPRWRIYCQPIAEEWFQINVPCKGFVPDTSPTYLQFKYVAINVMGLSANDNTTILIDGLHFADDYTYYTTSNSINYTQQANLMGWIHNNSKTQTYAGTDYDSYYVYTEIDETHDYENLESEVLGHFLYAGSYIYNLTGYTFILTELEDTWLWLKQMQYLNQSSLGYGGIYQCCSTGTMAGTFKDTYLGWLLAGMSAYYSISANATLKTRINLLRAFLCNVLWDDTNDWFDTALDPTDDSITQATQWLTMPNGAILTGLGTYLRYVETNSTVESIINQCYSKGAIRTGGNAGANIFTWAGENQHENTMYNLHGMYQCWQATDNVTYRQEFLNVTNIAFGQSMNSQNGSMFQRLDFCASPNPVEDKRKFDGWGMACQMPLLFWAYDYEADSHILDLIKLMLYETFYEGWSIPAFNGIRRYYGIDAGAWQNQSYVLANTFIYWAGIRYLQSQATQPYGVSINQRNALTAEQYAGKQLSLQIDGTGTSTTHVDCADEGEPLEVTGATTWNYNNGVNLLTLTVDHASTRDVTIKWKKGGAGYFVFTVHVKQESQPLAEVTVTVKPLAGSKEAEVNKTTNHEGLAQFELTYGSYLVKAYYDKKVKTMMVWLTSNQQVGFDFSTPPAHHPRLEGLLIVPIVFVLGYLLLRRARR